MKMNGKLVYILLCFCAGVFTTVLCWPTEFATAPPFYRAMFINIVSILFAEVPKINISQERKGGHIIQIGLTVFGVVLMGAAWNSMNGEADVGIAVGEWVYFWASTSMLIISLINFISDFGQIDDRIVKSVTALDPTNRASREKEG